MIKFLIKHLLPRVYEEIGQEYCRNETTVTAKKNFRYDLYRNELIKTRNLKKVSN